VSSPVSFSLSTLFTLTARHSFSFYSSVKTHFFHKKTSSGYYWHLADRVQILSRIVQHRSVTAATMQLGVPSFDILMHTVLTNYPFSARSLHGN